MTIIGIVHTSPAVRRNDENEYNHGRKAVKAMMENRPKSKTREGREFTCQIVRRELTLKKRGNGVMLTDVSNLRKGATQISTDTKRRM